MTPDQLDQVCGGTPTVTLSCETAHCSRTVGPYYSQSTAEEAMRDHRLYQHAATPTVRGSGG